MKQVEKIWAELSAKAQEVETPQEVELSEEKKVELKVGDNMPKLANEIESTFKNVDKLLDEAFTPIRRIEKQVDELLDPSDFQKEFKSFTTALMKLESAYAEARQTIQNAENDLGVSIPEPKNVTEAVRVLERFQRQEETLRKEINEYSQAYKKFK
jgi:DNA repair ATPase RecN